MSSKKKKFFHQNINIWTKNSAKKNFGFFRALLAEIFKVLFSHFLKNAFFVDSLRVISTNIFQIIFFFTDSSLSRQDESFDM